MKEADWQGCIEQNSAIKSSIDVLKVKSLISTANGRLEFIKQIEANQKNANYILEIYYTSLLELTHALVLKEGFKVSNHICLGFFLRDYLKKDDLFRLFDDLRYKRNSLVYYGKEMEYTVALESIDKIQLIIKKIRVLLNQKD